MPVQLEDIQEEFADLDLEVTDDSVLIHLKSLCERYNIDANKLSCEYFSFNTKLKVNQPPTLESLVTFENDKLKTMKKKVLGSVLDPIEGLDNLPNVPDLGTPTTKHSQAKRHITPDSHLGKRFVSAIGSPVTPSYGHSQATSDVSTTPGSRYADRKNSGEVVTRFGDTAGETWSSNHSEAVEVSCDDKTSLSGPYKFQFERLRDRAAVLDELICSKGETIVKKNHLEEGQNTSVPHPEQHVAIGRVACDADGRLNSNSVVLHGSLDTTGGHVIPLDLRNVTDYSLFPGQIVAVDCTNPNTSRLLANNVYSDAGPQLPDTSLDQGKTLDIVLACGPYTTSDSFLYRPLHDILDYVKTKNPDVAILAGPFVDAKHPKLEEASETFDAMFESVYNAVTSVLDDVKTHIILVASHRDAHHDFIYPTPPLALYPPEHDKYNPRLHSVSDPALININGVIVGVTSTDVLLHLGKEEISFPPRSGDRLSRLARHLTQQQSFYPLYPPSEEVNIDYERLEIFGNMTTVPHLMLLPSDLGHFVKEVDQGCIAVNPGRVTKGTGPGMFARIKLEGVKNGIEEKKCQLDVKAEIVRV